MLKLSIGFVIFAAITLGALFYAGGDIDMGGERHGAETSAPHSK
jgi:hypothetical protein